jgi:O-phosphoseryl-tRNA(Cys) synthetase
MKIMVTEVENEGLTALMGKTVTLFCGVYIYTGKLVGVNDTCVKLKDAGIVYQTGSFTDKKWKDCQSLPNDWYVTTQSIESFGELK